MSRDFVFGGSAWLGGNPVRNDELVPVLCDSLALGSRGAPGPAGRVCGPLGPASAMEFPHPSTPSRSNGGVHAGLVQRQRRIRVIVDARRADAGEDGLWR